MLVVVFFGGNLAQERSNFSKATFQGQNRSSSKLSKLSDNSFSCSRFRRRLDVRVVERVHSVAANGELVFAVGSDFLKRESTSLSRGCLKTR